MKRAPHQQGRDVSIEGGVVDVGTWVRWGGREQGMVGRITTLKIMLN